ncbi:hypothetical protein HWI03_005067 [Salmonella enterica]|nr:hypothetical protein [Salmonella enterica]EHE5102606.1 hypothetical protein [Salmonella enterica]EHQ1051592.1 hypothetical protein [Salmonella enterica]EIC4370396.1 hypothetical protein [Salmonella enterica]EJL1151727.1 hypothetical protein [Salmonella enterica]
MFASISGLLLPVPASGEHTGNLSVIFDCHDGRGVSRGVKYPLAFLSE